MLVKEARWIGDITRGISKAQDGIRLMNIGSSTGDFRVLSQPYIHERIFKPLTVNPRNLVVHCDLRAGEGIDVAADLVDPNSIDLLRSYACDSYLVSNLLEHVSDIDMVIGNLRSLVLPGQNLILTGPLNFPYHPDPIDNLFRPSRMEIVRLMEGFDLRKWKVVRHANIVGAMQGTTLEQVRSTLGMVKGVLPTPFGRSQPLSSLRPISAWCSVFTRSD